MTKKIFHAILLAAAAVLLASLVIVMGCLYSYFKTAQEKQMKDELRLAAYAVEESGRDYLERLSAQDFRYTWKPDYRLTWIAQDGTVLFDTVEPAGQMENHGGGPGGLCQGREQQHPLFQHPDRRDALLRQGAEQRHCTADFYPSDHGAGPDAQYAPADCAGGGLCRHSFRRSGPRDGR